MGTSLGGGRHIRSGQTAVLGRLGRWGIPRKRGIFPIPFSPAQGLVRGVSGWHMMTRKEQPGFAVVCKDAPDKRLLLYWLYYYMNRHVGDQVLDLSGTAPYYEPAGGRERIPGSLTPAVATLSADGNKVFLIVVNGSWSNAVVVGNNSIRQ